MGTITDPAPPAKTHRFRDNRFIIGGLSVLLLVCSAIYYLLYPGHGGTAASLLRQRLPLFVLWYANIILILTILFVIVRSLFRLLVDRRNRILGSKFKTKLVLTAIALSLLPVLILFPFATRLLIDSIEAWFNLPIAEVVTQARDTAEALTQHIEETAQRDAKRILEQVIAFDLRDLEQRPPLQRRLQTLYEEQQLDYLAIYDGTAFIHAVADPRAGIQDAPNIRRFNQVLEESIRRGSAVRIDDSLGSAGRLILVSRAAPWRAMATAPGQTAGEEEVADHGRYTVVVVGTVIPEDLAAMTESLQRAYQSYLQRAVQRDDLRATYLLLLLMVTLLIVLAFSYIGTRLARRVTLPIQALAEGTRRIGAGDLDHQVEVEVDDELGVLVDAFNRMTRELKRNRELVERSTQQLDAANKRLTDQRLRLASVLQNVAAGVISIDLEGRILTCNGAALRMLHQREEEVIGKSIHEAWDDAERGKLTALLVQNLSSGGELASQVWLTLGGVWRTLEVKVTPLPDASGTSAGSVVVLEDLTELIQAQQMATWNEVARRIAHEIKNPLTPIKLTAERLLRKHQQQDPELGTTLEEGVEIIAREVASLKTMVDEFSRFARMPRPQPRTVDLEKVIGDTVGLYQGLKPGVEVRAAVAPAAQEAWFDSEQLKSVLINLLDNAVQATDAPGEIVVSTSRVAADNGRAGGLRIHVTDSGRGIRPEDRDKLFTPYFSTKGRGTGLGLAIVHRIVSDHHATIRVEANKPRGTIFTLELPVQ